MKQFSQPPEAIILTMPVAFFKDRMGNPYTWFCSKKRNTEKFFGMHKQSELMDMYLNEFSEYFERFMRHEDATWHFKKKQLPTQDVAWVYLVWNGKVQFRLNFVQYERNVSKSFSDAWDGKTREFPKQNWIILSGPAIPAPYDMPMKGFQGHRYTEKLF